MTIPLSRNRNYQSLWGSRALSELGVQNTLVVFPLLALTITDSVATASLATAAVSASSLVLGIPGGALVDRWDRKKIMVSCEAALTLSMVSLMLAIWWNGVTLPHLIIVALVVGAAEALYEPAEEAALPHVVAEKQVSTALSLNAGRSALGQLVGPAIGGALYGLQRVLPFLASAVAHLLALVMLLFVRLPRTPREHKPIGHLGRDIVEGFRWVWGRKLMRATTLCIVAVNTVFWAFYIIVVFMLTIEQGASPASIGFMMAMLGVGALAGALASSFLCRKFSPYVIILGVFWACGVLTPLALVVQNAYFVGALLGAIAFLTPAVNITISTYQILNTPDELRGRQSSATNLAAGLAGMAGPALGGLLLEGLGSTWAVLACSVALVVVAVVVTVSPTMRTFPPIEYSDSETSAV
jgi:MFS family permease